jgi:anti-sigma B factor antagonist
MPELIINERRVGDVIVLDLRGDITIGEECRALREALRRLLARGQRKILLNLTEVMALDSAGLGELVSAYAAVARADGQIKLSALPPRVEDLMALTKLLTVFDTYADEEAALNSYTFGKDYVLTPVECELDLTDLDRESAQVKYSWAAKRPE